jgi:hypothetical protein
MPESYGEILRKNSKKSNKYSNQNRLPVATGRRFSFLSVYFFGKRINHRTFALSSGKMAASSME